MEDVQNVEVSKQVVTNLVKTIKECVRTSCSLLMLSGIILRVELCGSRNLYQFRFFGLKEPWGVSVSGSFKIGI